jgi:hypothetical protein
MYDISNITSPVKNSKPLWTLFSVQQRIVGAFLTADDISSLDYPSFSDTCIFLLSFSRPSIANLANTWMNAHALYSIPNSYTHAKASCR